MIRLSLANRSGAAAARWQLGKLLSILLFWLFQPASRAQGTVALETLVRGQVDAIATFANGQPVNDDGYVGQLYATPAGQPASSLTPVLPVAPMRQGYVAGSQIKVPGIDQGAIATVQIRVYNGPDWDQSFSRGASLPITIRLSGGLNPPAYLVGLQPFVVSTVPEPDILVLGALGAVAMWLQRTRRS